MFPFFNMNYNIIPIKRFLALNSKTSMMAENTTDWSGLVLIAANILTIILAVLLQYDFGVMIWSYWAESVIIGIFTIVGMITIGLMSKNILGWFSAVLTVGFFTVHYGMFHFIYAVFLLVIPLFVVNNWVDVTMTTGILFLSHLFSFIYNSFLRKQTQTTVDKMMLEPYGRIVPMHLTIMLSGFIIFIFPSMDALPKTILLVVFMSLKTIGDFLAHRKKHTVNQE
ncbi:Uncharacterised protein [Candidatus Bilamarchaeum dharawalense]|uniref:Uncharacterized protein n=1 Tax=Candidatus Bilamarchaeum dharawalense TaxID=2885759 RepID=A0A5E4LQR9_9ARCH|nr:Uncharacterised protein [Candidatus Bilamarchaeum dharawalense]